MQELRRNKYKQTAQKKKLHTYVSIEDIQRLEVIKNRCGYKSMYQLLQNAIYCLLRVADPENDPIIEPIPDEIRDMFNDFSDAEKHICHKTKVNTISPDDLK
jgi:hypothetical protein